MSEGQPLDTPVRGQVPDIFRDLFLTQGQVPDTLLIYSAPSFISSDIRRKRTKEDCYPQGPLQRGMQSQDLEKPQIPPTFLAGRDFGLYCLMGPCPIPLPLIIYTMLKHSGSAARQGADSPDERRLEIYFYGREPGGF